MCSTQLTNNKIHTTLYGQLHVINSHTMLSLTSAKLINVSSTFVFYVLEGKVKSVTLLYFLFSPKNKNKVEKL